MKYRGLPLPRIGTWLWRAWKPGTFSSASALNREGQAVVSCPFFPSPTTHIQFLRFLFASSPAWPAWLSQTPTCRIWPNVRLEGRGHSFPSRVQRALPRNALPDAASETLYSRPQPGSQETGNRKQETGNGKRETTSTSLLLHQAGSCALCGCETHPTPMLRIHPPLRMALFAP